MYTSEANRPSRTLVGCRRLWWRLLGSRRVGGFGGLNNCRTCFRVANQPSVNLFSLLTKIKRPDSDIPDSKDSPNTRQGRSLKTPRRNWAMQNLFIHNIWLAFHDAELCHPQLAGRCETQDGRRTPFLRT